MARVDVAVTGLFIEPRSGDPATGVVRFLLPQPIVSPLDGFTIEPVEVEAALDLTGRVDIVLSTVSGVNAVYVATVSITGADPRRFEFVVPASGDPIDLAAVQPIIPVLTDVPAQTTDSGPFLRPAANLSDVASAATARTNLGLGTAATQPTSAFDAAGAAATAQTAERTRALAAEAVVAADLSTETARATTAEGALASSIAGTTVVDATSTTKGVLRLAGDLGGTASAPTVPALADKADASALAAEASRAATAEGLAVQKAANLSDLTNSATARSNLGLGSAATQASSAFDAAGAAASAQAASQPLDSDLTAIAALSTTSFGRALLALADAAAGRTALALGSAATASVGDFDPAGVAAAVSTALASETSRATAAEAAAVQRSNHTGFQLASTISDFTEAAQDAIGAAATDSATLDLTYDDAAGTISGAVLDSPKVGGVAVSGTPSVGNVITALSAGVATWSPVPSAPVSSVNGRTGAVTGLAEASALSTETSRATAAEALALLKSANLSDLASATTARTNLGLGSAATQPSSAFDTAGAAAAAQAASQPVDSDLTAIAALSTTSFGRSLLALADGSALAAAIPSGTFADIDEYGVNVEHHGLAVGNSAAANAAALQALIAAVPDGSVIYFPHIYAVATDVITIAKKNLTLRGSGMWSGGIQPTVGGYLFQPGGFAENLTIEDMFFGGTPSGQPYIAVINANGNANVTIRRNRFYCNAGIIATGVNKITVEDNLFYTPGTPLIGMAVNCSAGTKRVVFRRNTLLYMNSGLAVGTGGTDEGAAGGGNGQIAEHFDISDNYFDSGWWLGKAQAVGSGSTVTYAGGTSQAVLTDTSRDTAPAVPFTTVIPDGQEQSYSLRVLRPCRSSSGSAVSFTYGSTEMVDTAADFTATAVPIHRGDIIRTASAFAVVTNIQSATTIGLEEWLSSSTYEPVAPPAAGTAYTIYNVRLGLIVARTATTVTLNELNPYDMTGFRDTPGAGTLYEIVGHGVYAIHTEYSCRYVKCHGNTVRRQWADGISLYGYRGSVQGNLVQDGQDFGLTLHGTNWRIMGNHFDHNGTVAILVPDKSICMGNIVTNTTWTNQVDAYLGGISTGGSGNIISENIIDGGLLPWARYGINVATFSVNITTNIIRNNTLRGHTVADLHFSDQTAGAVSMTDQQVSGNILASRFQGAAVPMLASGGLVLGNAVVQNGNKGATVAGVGRIWSVEEDDGTPALNYSGQQFNCYGYSYFAGPMAVVSAFSVSGQSLHQGTFRSTGSATFEGPDGLEVTTANKGVILKSADGTRYLVTVANDGALVTAAL